MTTLTTATRTLELLAPAGDWEAMRAAVANGANAVYFGLNRFNARHRATNFPLDELPAVMTYLHGHNVRGYVTLNTLIFSDELEEMVEYLGAIARAGVDAVIVQDLGLVRLIHRLAPHLHVHGSTQMTLTEPRGVDFVRGLGVERVILARELSVSDIKKITAATDVPVEVFVHGALCIAYSGQCLTSEALGGRSANRGQCAQACRLPYQLIVDGVAKDLGDKAYLLSPQDLAAYDLIGELAEAGVVSFKIEGRLKSAHYVAATTQTYRAAIDDATKGLEVGDEERAELGISNFKFQISEQQRWDLEQSFSRGFSPGFLAGVNHQRLVPARFPKARGTKIGTVAAVTPRGVVVKVEAARSGDFLKPGDGVVFDEGHPEQDEQGGRVYAVRAASGGVEITFREGDVNLAALAVGALVWKTDDPAMKRRLEHSFSRDTVVHRVKLAARVRARVGQALSITLSAEGVSASASSEQLLEKAQKFPFTEAVAREQLGRLGDTPFELANLEMDVADGPMVPKSLLNDLRRRAIEKLLALRSAAGSHTVEHANALQDLRTRVLEHVSPVVPIVVPTVVPTLSSAVSTKSAISPNNSPTQTMPSRYEDPTEAPLLHVLVRTLEQLESVLTAELPLRPTSIYCDFEDVRRYKDAVARCRAANMPVMLATLRVVKPGEEGLLKQIADCQPDGVLVRNLAAVSYFAALNAEATRGAKLEMIGDFSLNVANELTAGIFFEAGLTRVVPSYDLNWKQMGAMLRRLGAGSEEAAARCEAVIHQHMPMFHMEHCVFAATLSTGKDFHDCGRPCERHQVDLTDRVGQPHPLTPDVGCRNTLFNAQAQTAAEFIPEMKTLGMRHFRVELLRENGAEAVRLLERYGRAVLGIEEVRETVRSLRVLSQLGVTRGTLERE